MKRATLFAAVLMASAATALAQPMSEPTVRVGGQAMFPSKTIVANAVNSADHTTLVAAVKAAGLVDRVPARSQCSRRPMPHSISCRWGPLIPCSSRKPGMRLLRY